MKTQTLAALLAICVLVVSGCADSGAKKAAVSSQAPPATATEDSGGIDGLVVDDEQAPIEGANVTLQAQAAEFRASATTTADGRYSFSKLDEGSYELVIAAFGYETRVTKADVRAGEVTAVASSLVRIIVAEALPETLIKKGFINCSVSHPSHEGFYSINPCRNQGGEASQIPWVIDAKRNASEAIIELVWKPGTGGSGERLQLWLCSDKDDTTNYMNCIQFVGPNPYSIRVHGKSPVVMRQTNLPFKTVSNYEVDVGDGYFEGTSARVPVTIQQSFDVYLTACYGKVCPPEFRARPPE